MIATGKDVTLAIDKYTVAGRPYLVLMLKVAGDDAWVPLDPIPFLQVQIPFYRQSFIFLSFFLVMPVHLSSTTLLLIKPEALTRGSIVFLFTG